MSSDDEISLKDLIVGEMYECEEVRINNYFTINCFVRITETLPHNKNYQKAWGYKAWGYICQCEADKDGKKTVELNQTHKFGLNMYCKGNPSITYSFKRIKPHTDDILRAMKNAAAADEDT